MVECENPYCLNSGYACGDIEAWNQVMSGICSADGIASIDYAKPCAICGKQPYLAFTNRAYCINEKCANFGKHMAVKDWNAMSDKVNHPDYYNWLPGVECIQVTDYFNFNLGNVIKYLWRAGLKSSTTKLEDLQKAKWYLEREISFLEQHK